AVLNHISGHKSGVAGIYNKNTYEPEKRVALELWGNHIRVIVAQSDGANVHKLKRNIRRMTINLQPQDRELIELTLEDLRHIAKEASPECDDHQLRRLSVQLRNLLIEDCFVRSWKLLQLQPKSPTIIAPRLRTDGLGPNDFSVAGGGNVGGVQ